MNFQHPVFKRFVSKVVIFCYLFVIQQIMPVVLVAGIAGFSSSAVQATEVSLSPGFNLFSYPVSLPGNGLRCSELKNLLGAQQLKHLDGATQLIELCQDSDFFIDLGIGYIAEMAQSSTVSLTGEQGCATIDLHPGLNLIGVPTPIQGSGCFDLLTLLGDQNSIASIQRFDKEQGVFQSCVYDPLLQTGVPQGNDFPIRSGEAYLVSSHVELNNINVNDLSQCQPVFENRPPILDTIGSQIIASGQTLHLTLSASDPDGDKLHFTSSTLPLPEHSGLNAQTGEFTFTPDGSQTGTFQLNFIVSENVLTDAETVSITVQTPDPNAPTQLTGRLLDTNDFVLNTGLETPVVGATVSLVNTGISSVTDANGFFTLNNAPFGQQLLDIDSSTAQPGPKGATYAGFREKITLIENIDNNITRPFFLPQIAAESLTTVDPNTTTTVSNATLGISLVIPPNTAKNPDGSDFTGEISISLVPSGLTPAVLPETVDPGLLVTLQPVGVSFSDPVKITFPNIDQLPPGSAVELWSLNPDAGKFISVGIGRVVADGSAIEIIDGGVRANDWHYILPLPVQQKTDPNQNSDGKLCESNCLKATGSFTDASSGNLMVDHNLVSYRSLGLQRSLRMIYSSNHADPQPIISSLSVLPTSAIIPNQLSSTLELGGIAQGTEIFTDASTLDINMPYRQVLQFDASEIETGFYPYKLMQRNHYAQSTVASILRGNVLINNQSQSPFGAGWTLDGVNRLKTSSTGSLVLARGDGRTQIFTRTVAPSAFDSPKNFPIQAIEGVSPDYAGTGDFNEDGFLDFAMTNRDLPEISLFLADGNGGFLPPIQLLIGADLDTRGTQGLTVADFNNDTHLDIAVTLKGDNKDVSINLGDGSGSFAQPLFLESALARNPAKQIESADLNRDGNIDLIYSQGTNDVSTWLGDGNGAFQENLTTRIVGPSCSCSNTITIADFDNDSIPDIASFGSVLRVYFGDGKGGFNRAVRRELARTDLQSSGDLTVGDMDQDGNMDLIASAPSFPTAGVFVFFGDGQRRFSDPVRAFSSSNLNEAPLGVAVGDVNDDGVPDIVTALFGGSQVLVSTGNGAGGFARPVSFSTSCNAPIRTILAKFNNDENLDMLAQCLNSPGSADIFINKPGSEKIFAGPAGEFSTIIQQSDGQFVQQLKNGSRFLYNASGLQTAVIDRNENRTSFSYDASDHLITITDPAELQTTFNYTVGLLSSIVDPTGRTTNISHDSTGNLTGISDPNNSSRQFAYDPHHRLLTQTSKRGFATNYSYDFAGRNIKAVRPDNAVFAVAPSQTIGLVDPDSGLGSQNNPAPLVVPEQAVALYRDGNNKVTQYKTTRFGSPTEIIDPLGSKTVINRDNEDNPTQIIAPNGAVIEMSYDNVGNLLTRTEAVGSPLQKQSTMTYEPDFNQLTQITDPEGNITLIDYDAKGNPVKITDPLSNEQLFTYNAQGLLLTRTDQNGHVSTWTYDSNGNIATVTDAEGNKTILSRDAAGNIVSRTDAFGTAVAVTNSFTYDALNRLLTRTDGTGAVTQFRYDAQGNLLETENATGQIVKRSYDETNHLIKIETPVSGITQFKYDANGNIIEQTDALNQKTAFSYDAVNQLIQSTDALAQVQSFEYDVQGNLLALQNAAGQSTQFAYDLLNRLTQQTNPLGLKTAFSYDKRNRLLTRTDPKGQLLTNSYDALSRRTQTVTADDTLRYSYDVAGNLLTVTDNDSSLSYTYDALNRIATAQTLDVGFQPAVLLTNRYNALSNRIQLDDSAGGTTQFSYDLANRLTRLVTPAGDTIDENYDPTGRLQQITRPNNIISDYSYDVQGRLVSITHALTNFSYGYNALGNITSITEPGKPRTFTYDALQRLITGGTATVPENYSYDALGNRIVSHLSASHSHDMANRLLEDDQFRYDYDDNGNLISKTAKTDASVTSYRYDALNRLVGIDFADGTAADYRYDVFGRRIEKDVNGAMTRYVYDGADILLEYDGSNTLIARYSHGQQTDQPLSMERGGMRYFYQADHLGSIRKIVDINGVEVNSYDYDAYGRVESSVEGIVNPFTYTGRELDSESGLYFYRARYYDSQTGRFINEDPIGFAGGDGNFYRYVLNNSVNFVDAFGLVGAIPPTGGGRINPRPQPTPPPEIPGQPGPGEPNNPDVEEALHKLFWPKVNEALKTLHKLFWNMDKMPPQCPGSKPKFSPKPKPGDQLDVVGSVAVLGVAGLLTVTAVGSVALLVIASPALLAAAAVTVTAATTVVLVGAVLDTQNTGRQQ